MDIFIGRVYPRISFKQIFEKIAFKTKIIQNINDFQIPAKNQPILKIKIIIIGNMTQRIIVKRSQEVFGTKNLKIV